jgi:RND family efflux transporter MFP subunit
MMMQQDEHKRDSRGARWAGWAIAAVALLALGWLARGLMPGAPAGGGRPPMGMMPPGGATAVVTHTPELAALNPPASFIGQVEPIQSVGLRAQIEGLVEKVHFQEGSMVNAGDPLFTIEAAIYEARVALRRAELAGAEAELDRAQRYLKRLEAADARGILQTDLDTARSGLLQSQAAVQQAQATLELATIDLRHTRITAPITGRIGRTVANTGDFVSPSLGTLAHIVQLDPIRVVFSVPDRDYLELRESVGGAAMPTAVRIRLRLPTGTIPEMTGSHDFEETEMMTGTATLPVRVRFANPDGMLVPNGYVTVLIDKADAKPYPVVSQAAVLTDREGPFLYVIAEGAAQVRRVKTGPSLDGRIEIRSGLAADEPVIVEGLQKIRPGMPVQAKVAQKAGGS